VGTQTRLAVAEAPAATFQLAHDFIAHSLPQEQVGVVEVLEKLREECVAISGHGFLNALKDTAVELFRLSSVLSKNGLEKAT
jgi:hypothetical protein